jgi:hypothetical protein
MSAIVSGLIRLVGFVNDVRKIQHRRPPRDEAKWDLQSIVFFG